MTELESVKEGRADVSTRRLLDAAASLIAEQGYERTTLAAIGARAGYSHGLVTRRFGSKDGLLWALVDRMVVQWEVQHLGPVLEDAVGVDALQLVLAEIRDSVRRSPDDMRALYSLMFEALTPIEGLRERFAALHGNQRRGLARIIEHGIDVGVVRRDADPPLEAALLLGAIRGAAYQWMLDRDGVDLDELLAAISAQLNVTLRAPRRARRKPSTDGD